MSKKGPRLVEKRVETYQKKPRHVEKKGRDLSKIPNPADPMRAVFMGEIFFISL